MSELRSEVGSAAPSVSDRGHAGGHALDPGPAAPPPPMGRSGGAGSAAAGGTVRSGASDAGGASNNGDGFDLDKHVADIKKRALLRLTLAGTRGSERIGRSSGEPLTPAQYAHMYRTGDHLPLNTPDALGGFTGRPAQARPGEYIPQSSALYGAPHATTQDQHGGSYAWPPPPPPASVPRQHPAMVEAGGVMSPFAPAPAHRPVAALQVASSPLTALGSPRAGYSRPAAVNESYAMRPPDVGSDKSIRWKRVVQRDQNGELPETVQWIREEVLT